MSKIRVAYNLNPVITGLGIKSGVTIPQGSRVKIEYEASGSRCITLAAADDAFDGFTFNQAYITGNGPRNNPFEGGIENTTIWRRGMPATLLLAMSSAGNAGQKIYADADGKHTTVAPAQDGVVIGTLTKAVRAPVGTETILGEVEVR